MKIFKFIIIVISAAAAILFSALLFFVFTEYKPAESEVLTPVYDSALSQTADESPTPGGLRILTWNTGYCGLNTETDFFLEGGSNTDRLPLERQRTALNEIIGFIDAQEADICLLQEVDTDSKRSWSKDQLYTAVSVLKNYEAYYAINYKSPFVPVPLESPIGRVKSGIAMFSRYAVSRAERLKLPGQFSWPVRLFHLKRCALISSIPSPVAGKNWYIINVHLSAYDEGGMREMQLEYVKNLITELYADGHYVVVGGDWNLLLPGTDKTQFGSYNTSEENLGWVKTMPATWTPGNWQWCYDEETPTARSLEQPYSAGENFTCIIDGFLVSPNLRVDEVEAFNLRFEHSDHNPAAITVSIR
ncbi:MAG: endonuclease/exonuclease/phosphatase family protein [Spirochaetales bacterium]|uniref:Endonuclease/exonuclease/phosphatase family protein n=1 Tax=Candidatus Thalassospirochaeta sargassi TaxID=3119039 RepID=A0AAJ1IDD2_9SPIO|nr:endonuclease/exonuclease/phosphatase family protein [Spirochaetales bacterium]